MLSGRRSTFPPNVDKEVYWGRWEISLLYHLCSALSPRPQVRAPDSSILNFNAVCSLCYITGNLRKIKVSSNHRLMPYVFGKFVCQMLPSTICIPKIFEQFVLLKLPTTQEYETQNSQALRPHNKSIYLHLFCEAIRTLSWICSPALSRHSGTKQIRAICTSKIMNASHSCKCDLPHTLPMYKRPRSIPAHTLLVASVLCCRVASQWREAYFSRFW